MKKAALLFLALWTARGGTIQSVWNGGAGDWSNASAWSPAFVPNNIINPPNPDIRFFVTLNSGTVSTTAASAYAIDGLLNAAVLNIGGAGLSVGSTIGFASGPLYFSQGFSNSGTVNVQSGSQLNVDVSGPAAGNVIFNNGNINVAGTLSVYGDPPGVTLHGTGSLNMQGGSILFNRNLGDFGTMTNQSTIQGYGDISAGTGFGINNTGLVNANDPLGRALAVSTGLNPLGDPSYSANTGIMQASGGGTLWLRGSLQGWGMTNIGGTVRALTGSTVLIDGGIVGGTLATSGTGQLVVASLDANGNRVASSGAYLSGLPSAVNITGPLQVAGGSTLTLWGDIASNGGGTIQLGTAATPATLQVKSNDLLSGLIDPYGGVAQYLPGAVTLDHTANGPGDFGQFNKLTMAPNTGNAIAGVTGPTGLPVVLNVTPNYTIDGAGSIRNTILYNQGTINVSQGVPLTLDWSGVVLDGYPTMVNWGTINVAANNTLVLQGNGAVGGSVGNTCHFVPGPPGMQPYCIDNFVGGRIALHNNSTLQVAGGNATYFVINGGVVTGDGANSSVTLSGATGAEYLQTVNGQFSSSVVVDKLHWYSNDSITLAGGNTITVNPNASAGFFGSLLINPNSSVTVNGNLINWDPNTGVLTGQSLGVYGAVNPGDTPGTLRFAGADIRHLGGNTYLQGNAQITDLNGNDALRNLAGVDGGLQLDGRQQTSLAPAFSGAGALNLDNGSVFHLPNAISFSQGTLTVTNGSTLDLPAATTFGGGDVTFSNGGKLNLPQATAFNVNTLTVDNASLSLSSGATATTVYVQDNATLQLGGALNIAAHGSATVFDASVLSAKGADIQNVLTLWSSQTTDFTGGQFHNIDSAGTLQYGVFILGGDLVYDTHGGDSAATISTIGANADLELHGGQILSSTNGVTTNALGHISQVNGALASYVDFSTDQFLTIGNQGIADFIGSSSALGIDNHGVLAIVGHGWFVGTDTPAIQNHTLLYGSFDINGTLDYSGQSINTIAAGASVTLRGAGSEMIHHSTPGDALASLVDVGGTLAVSGGATLTSDQTIHNDGTIVISGGTLTAPGLVQDGSNASLFNFGTLELNGGTLSVLAGSFVNGATIDGNLYIDVPFDYQGTITGSLTLGSQAVLTLNPADSLSLDNPGTVKTSHDPGADAYTYSLGDYTQEATGTLEMVIAGPDQGVDYDWISIQGHAHFAGALDVSWGQSGNQFCFFDEFFDLQCNEIGMPGAVFNLLSWGAGMWDGSKFSSYDLPTLDPGLGWAEQWSTTGFSLEVVTNPTPEPGTWIMIAAAALLWLVRARVSTSAR